MNRIDLTVLAASSQSGRKQVMAAVYKAVKSMYPDDFETAYSEARLSKATNFNEFGTSQMVMSGRKKSENSTGAIRNVLKIPRLLDLMLMRYIPDMWQNKEMST